MKRATRAALKGAIVARNEVASRVEATRQALDRIGDQVFEAQRKLREARASAAEDARARVERIVAGGAATLELNGRQREAAIEEEIGAIKAARELTRAAVSDGERSLDLAEMRVVDAVGGVLATSAGKLIVEAEAGAEGIRRVRFGAALYPVGAERRPASADR